MTGLTVDPRQSQKEKQTAGEMGRKAERRTGAGETGRKAERRTGVRKLQKSDL